MTAEPWYWIVFTVLAAAAQTGRNAMQRDLTTRLGTIGATLVRFMYGLPFAILACALILGMTGSSVPIPPSGSLSWALIGAVAQILATMLLLAAMQGRSFVVAIALSKIEPVWVGLFSLVLLGEMLELELGLAIVLATSGVLAVSWPERGTPWALRPVLMGVGSGAMFGVSAIGFRGAILGIPDADFASAASLMLVVSMSVQTVMLCAWLRIIYPGTLTAVIAAWRPSLLTGALAAAASLCWFLAFALESAARVRTLALVELIFAHLLSRRLFGQGISSRERLGLALLVIGVVIVLSTGWKDRIG
jgi:drug/metabolite transporter (DMT)-like permease